MLENMVFASVIVAISAEIFAIFALIWFYLDKYLLTKKNKQLITKKEEKTLRKERKIEMMKYNLDWVKTRLKAKEKNKLKKEKLDEKSWNMTKIYKMSKNKAADNVGAIMDDFYDHELRRSSVKRFNGPQSAFNFAKKSQLYAKKAETPKK